MTICQNKDVLLNNVGMLFKYLQFFYMYTECINSINRNQSI